MRLDYTCKHYETSLKKEESLVAETLVKEISMATRWSAVLDAFNALRHIRAMAGNMHAEVKQNEGIER